MAFGSGSSLATDCSTKRRDLPVSLQLLRAGRASRLHQVSSRKPTTQPRRPSARRINRLRRLFSLVLRIGAGYPAFSPLPAHPQPRQGSPNGLARDPFLREALLEAHLGGEIQRPQTRVFAELPGSLVQHLPQGLSLLGIEGPMDSVRMLGAWLKRFRESLLVEGMDSVARRLQIAAQLVSDLVGVFAPVASEQDLATAQGEGIRRTQACLQGLALGVTQGTHEDRSFHAMEDNY